MLDPKVLPSFEPRPKNHLLGTLHPPGIQRRGWMSGISMCKFCEQNSVAVSTITNAATTAAICCRECLAIIGVQSSINRTVSLESNVENFVKKLRRGIRRT